MCRELGDGKTPGAVMGGAALGEEAQPASSGIGEVSGHSEWGPPSHTRSEDTGTENKSQKRSVRA